jgi:tyrosyl-tRNA synthetase
MSKSFDNFIALTDPPEEMFGKVMSIPDTALDGWERIAIGPAGAAVGDGEATHAEMPEAARRKRRLARGVVADFHGADEAERQEQRFDQVHRDHVIPSDVPTVPLPAGAVRDGMVWLPRLLVALGLATSNGDARRKLQDGAVRVDGAVLTDHDLELSAADLLGRVVQVGRHRFVRIGSAPDDPGSSAP